MIQLLKFHVKMTQNRMVQVANSRRSERSFQIRDNVSSCIHINNIQLEEDLFISSSLNTMAYTR